MTQWKITDHGNGLVEVDNLDELEIFQSFEDAEDWTINKIEERKKTYEESYSGCN